MMMTEKTKESANSSEAKPLRIPIETDAAVEVVTAADPAAGEVIRHSAEHVMADAVKRVFPDVQIDVGRSDHSEKFQYDFLVERPFTPEDLERIQARMQELSQQDHTVHREVMDRDEGGVAAVVTLPLQADTEAEEA